MAQLQSTNVTGVLCVNGVAVGGGKDFKFCCFTTSTTWTPPADLVDGDGVVESIIVGGGGGGIGNPNQFTGFGGGGGGGGVIERLHIMTSSNDACTITIGAGGATCTVGGDSSFDGITAYGGGSSTSRATSAGSISGVACGGGGGGSYGSATMCDYTSGIAHMRNAEKQGGDGAGVNNSSISGPGHPIYCYGVGGGSVRTRPNRGGAQGNCLAGTGCPAIVCGGGGGSGGCGYGGGGQGADGIIVLKWAE